MLFIARPQAESFNNEREITAGLERFCSSILLLFCRKLIRLVINGLN